MGLLLQLVVIASLLVLGQGAEVSRKKVYKVSNKLESFALGSAGLSSGLTMQDLKDAHDEYKTWDKETVDKIKQTLSLDKLLLDFLLIPMDKHSHLIDESEKDGEQTPQQLQYVKRLENNYRKFRPAYLGQSLGKWFKARKTDTLVGSLYEVTHSTPPTERMFKDAMAELSAYKAKIEEIVEFEDIYSSLAEFESLMNYINRQEVHVLEDIIFPLFKSQPSPKDFDALKARFVTEMRARKIEVRNGALVRLP